MLTVNIIGSSGRNDTIDCNIFNKAKQQCINYIKNLECDIGDITLQSGGSSGIDHLAVILFLEGIDNKEFKSLKLFMPCGFDKKFIAKNIYEKTTCDTLNELHKKFTKEIGQDSINDLNKIINDPRVIFIYGMGFFHRNRLLASSANNTSSITIAMTFSENDKPSNGGTNYTWNLIKEKKIHFTLVKN